MLVIRDDDLSFWTDVEQVKELYGDFLLSGGKVSFATVPCAYKAINRGDRTKLYQEKEKMSVSNNIKLVDYLRPYVNNGQVEIMLHGYDHGYFVDLGNELAFLDKELREKIVGADRIKYIPECCAKDEERLRVELIEGKKILEDTFGCRIRVFVPPSNALTPQAAAIVDKMGLNISGTITDKFNRKKDIYGILVYIKKVLWRLTHKDVSYPGIMRYKNHMELIGHAFTPTMNMESFVSQLRFCKDHGYPFVLATHYWQLLMEDGMKKNFYKLIYTETNMKDIVTMSEVFSRYMYEE